MFSKLRSTYREIVRAPAGSRFHRYHQRRKGNGGRWRSALHGSAGLILVISGFLLSLPPLLPGFLLWLPGLALIASQFGCVARCLDRSERMLHQLYRRIGRHNGT